MFDHIENLEIIGTFRNEGKPIVKVENRKMNAFFIRRSGSVLYDFGDRKIVSETGGLMFVPKGSVYTAISLTPEHSYTSIHFEGKFFIPPKAGHYSLEHFMDLEFIEDFFTDYWNFGTAVEKYRCYSLFYSLLSHLSKTEQESGEGRERYHMIDPAVEYLKEHLYDCDLKMEKLSRICGISGTYFRKIFLDRFGSSPQNYISSKRLSHAKALIASGDFDSISELARSVGYNDPLYFSKAFKRTFGISPSQMNRE